MAGKSKAEAADESERDSEAAAEDAQEEPSLPVGEEPAEAEHYDPADRVPGEVTTPMREMEMDAAGKLRDQGHNADPDQPWHRPYIDGDPAKYRRSGDVPDWALRAQEEDRQREEAKEAKPE